MPHQDHRADDATSQRLAEILAEILDELRAQGRPSGALWAVRDIAAFTGYSDSYTHSKIITAQGFPRPRVMPGGGKRWMQDEVRAYFSKRNRG